MRDKNIYLQINGPITDTMREGFDVGWNVVSSLSQYDAIEMRFKEAIGGDSRHAKYMSERLLQSGLPITTHNTSFVGSASNILYSIGQSRYSEGGALFLWHKATISSPGDLRILNDNGALYLEYIEDRKTVEIARWVADHSATDRRIILQWHSKGENLMGPEELQQHGYVHKVKQAVSLNQGDDILWLEADMAFLQLDGSLKRISLNKKK